MQQIPVALLRAGATRPGLALEAGISQGDRQEALEPTLTSPAQTPQELQRKSTWLTISLTETVPCLQRPLKTGRPSPAPQGWFLTWPC